MPRMYMIARQVNLSRAKMEKRSFLLIALRDMDDLQRRATPHPRLPRIGDAFPGGGGALVVGETVVVVGHLGRIEGAPSE